MTYKEVQDILEKARHAKDIQLTAAGRSADWEYVWTCELAPFQMAQAPTVLITSKWNMEDLTLCDNSEGIEDALDWYISVNTMPFIVLDHRVLYALLSGKVKSQVDLNHDLEKLETAFKNRTQDAEEETVTDLCRPFREKGEK